MTPARTRAIIIDRSDRHRLHILGPDRAKFLHNLVTNEVKRLPAGRGCEAFVTSPQGKTIGYIHLHALEDHILVRSDPGGMALALPHFRKYGIFDDVEILDQSAGTFEFHLAGPTIEDTLQGHCNRLPDTAEYAHTESEIQGVAIRLIRESPLGLPGLTLIGPKFDADRVRHALEPLAVLDGDEYHRLRIEAGTPLFGAEVTEKNLPQEFGRDLRAISFVKGCYLGQETVARLDALGHVNQLMKGFLLDPAAPVPPPLSVLELDGKKVGTITSAASLRDQGAPVALGFVRSAHAAPGTKLSLRVPGQDHPITVTVTDLPFPPAG